MYEIAVQVSVVKYQIQI